MRNSIDTSNLGTWGESAAASYLRTHHYKLIGSNFRCRGGEIDIIAEKGNYIVFVEVKLRKDATFAQAREFVTVTKQSRIIHAAKYWLLSHPSKLQPRFDVIEIYAPDGVLTRKPEIIHIEDAFGL